MHLTWDAETSIKNKGNPFTASNKMISYSVKCNEEPVRFNYFNELNFLIELRESLEKAKLVIGFHLKFDLSWASRKGIVVPKGCRIWDCQLAEFIITGQKGSYPSLDDCCAKYGLGKKDDKIAEYWELGIDTEFIPREELEFYNNLDVELTYRLYLAQKAVMTEKQVRLLMLMGLDLLVLQEMEENGVKFDIELCKKKEAEAAKELAKLTKELLAYSPTPDINLGSGQQLSCLLYGGKFDIDYVTIVDAVYKSGPKKGTTYQKNAHNVVVYTCPRLFDPLPKTECKLKTKFDESYYETNEDVLKQLRSRERWKKRIIEVLLKSAELSKLLDTYYGKLPALLEEMEWGEYLHGQYNQVVASTGRLSSSKPNMQNFSGLTDQLLISRYD